MTSSATTKTPNGDTCTAMKIGTDTMNRANPVSMSASQFEVKGLREKMDTDKAALRKLMFQEGGDSFWECVP